MSRLPDPAFWAGRSVLVTGDTGFKGRWLTLWLRRLGAEVHGLSDRDGTEPPVDVRAPAAVLERFERVRPETVFHLAAQAIVSGAHDAPGETFATNVLGTVALLDAARAVGSAEGIVVVTSDKCYRNEGPRHAFGERDPLGGADPYSASKACQEHVASAYRGAYALPVVTVRAGNVIGGGDFSADRLIPDAVRAVRSGATLHIRNPNHVRPWQHALCCLHGYLLAAEGAPSPAYNFGPGPGDACTVGAIVERLQAQWPGLRVRWGAARFAPAEDPWLTLDSSRARAELGWAPSWGLDEAVARTLEWYAAEDPGACSEAQLDAYVSSAARGGAARVRLSGGVTPRQRRARAA